MFSSIAPLVRLNPFHAPQLQLQQESLSLRKRPAEPAEASCTRRSLAAASAEVRIASIKSLNTPVFFLALESELLALSHLMVEILAMIPERNRRIRFTPKKVSAEEYSCAYGSGRFFILCGFGGIISCGTTHTALVPLDLVKCRIQV
ncbi:hypothetical protein JD844_028150 [Phrynosoma platyrhinos]|uniref:Solute carrier family 25 member 3 n=1 Tax=Phrynosoma platyrhinos TaxID=52577 RepID=A0ABQ7SHG1_PHRPL|nr:hypothetical protein JD844_028150 [Phrynosoma platyrhinos]